MVQIPFGLFQLLRLRQIEDCVSEGKPRKLPVFPLDSATASRSFDFTFLVVAAASFFRFEPSVPTTSETVCTDKLIN
jgi:hypothetical protein